MNKGLQEKFGGNVAEKVGARWHLSAFMRDNWLSKTDEAEPETLPEKVWVQKEKGCWLEWLI